MEDMTHHGTPDSTWDSLGASMFAPYTQTKELWGETQDIDAPPLCQ